MSQYIYMGISYSDILTFLNYFCWCRIIQNKFFIQLFINDSSTVQIDNWWISTLFGRLCHFTFSSFIWTKWLNVMHLSLLSFFMIEADLFLWELCSLCCLFLMKSRFCVFLHLIPTGPESGFSVSDGGGMLSSSHLYIIGFPYCTFSWRNQTSMTDPVSSARVTKAEHVFSAAL